MRRSVLATGRYWPFRDLRGGQGASAADDEFVLGAGQPDTLSGCPARGGRPKGRR